MTEQQVIVYVAMSLDGFVADANDGLDFLNSVQQPDEDYGYFDFVETVGTVIMGRRTYEKVLSFNILFPHKSRQCYVLSNSLKTDDPNIYIYSGELKKLIEKAKKEKDGHIYIDAGGLTLAGFLQNNLIDQLVISVIPHILGSGKKLFVEGIPEMKLKLKKTISYPSGLVQHTYITNA